MSNHKDLKPPTFKKTLLILFGLIFGAVGVYTVINSLAAAPATANLWIDTSGGTCTRQATASAYSDTTACPTFDAAWDAASAGDTIVVKAGTYPTQKTTGNKSSETKIIGEDGTVISGTQECRPEFGAVAAFCTEAAFLTLENVTIDSGATSGIGSCTRIWTEASNVTWRNVKCVGDHVFVYVEAPNFKWLGGDLGGDDDGLPRITCTSGGGEPLWLQSGADGAVIDGIRFHKRLIQESPTPNTGTCGADGLPHLETVRFEDADDVTIKNSIFMAGSDAGSGHIFSSQPVNRLNLINNVFEPVNGTYWVQAGSIGCDWTVAYNTFTQGASLNCTNFLWVGNLGTESPGCSGTHIKNVWQGSGSCGSDTFVGSQSLGIGSGGHLVSTSPAINAAETDTGTDHCTGSLVGSVDLDGDTRPQGTACDAGADEFVDGSPPPPPPPPPPPGGDTTDPSVPQNTTYTSTTATSISLSWDASTDNVGVTGYRLYLNGSEQATTTNLTYSFTNLTCATTYTIGLTAYDAAGNESDLAQNSGTRSTSACDSTPPTPPPPPPPPPPAPIPSPSPSPSPELGDINRDGAVNILDLSILLSRYNQRGTNRADLNNDKRITVYSFRFTIH